jgi:hypothetical protein
MAECLFGVTIIILGISHITISTIPTTTLTDFTGDRVGDIAIHGTTVLTGIDMEQLDIRNLQFTAELTVDDQSREQI